MSSNLILSASEPVDRDQGCALAKQFHEESIFAEIPFSPEKFYAAFDATISEPTKFLGLKVMREDHMLGFCYASIGEYHIGKGVKMVTVITIFVDKEIRSSLLGGRVTKKLMQGVEVWGRKLGASYILYHVTAGNGVAETDKLFRKMGMTTLGGNYGVKL